MKTPLIALVTSLGIVFTLASDGLAQDQRHPSTTGKITGKSLKHGSAKTSLSLRGVPETRGGTLEDDAETRKVIFF